MVPFHRAATTAHEELEGHRRALSRRGRDPSVSVRSPGGMEADLRCRWPGAAGKGASAGGLSAARLACPFFDLQPGYICANLRFHGGVRVCATHPPSVGGADGADEILYMPQGTYSRLHQTKLDLFGADACSLLISFYEFQSAPT
jgi:hypothetical protein